MLIWQLQVDERLPPRVSNTLASTKHDEATRTDLLLLLLGNFSYHQSSKEKLTFFFRFPA
jgi:hypothetical protein